MRGLVLNSMGAPLLWGPGLTLVAEEVFASSRSVLDFILAGEQVSQILIYVFHLSPRGVL